MKYIKPTILLSVFLSILTSSCVTTRTTTNANGSVIEKKYVVKRPVKDFINNVEVE